MIMDGPRHRLSVHVDLARIFAMRGLEALDRLLEARVDLAGSAQPPRRRRPAAPYAFAPVRRPRRSSTLGDTPTLTVTMNGSFGPEDSTHVTSSGP